MHGNLTRGILWQTWVPLSRCTYKAWDVPADDISPGDLTSDVPTPCVKKDVVTANMKLIIAIGALCLGKCSIVVCLNHNVVSLVLITGGSSWTLFLSLLGENFYI